jgi:hypothetical protein
MITASFIPSLWHSRERQRTNREYMEHSSSPSPGMFTATPAAPDAAASLAMEQVVETMAARPLLSNAKVPQLISAGPESIAKN